MTTIELEWPCFRSAPAKKVMLQGKRCMPLRLGNEDASLSQEELY